MADSTHHIKSGAEFQELLSKNDYVVADFFAEWCGPCKAIAPHYKRLSDSKSKDGKFAFAKVDVDATPDIAAQYGVNAMPTFLFFEKGKPYGAKPQIRGADVRGLTATIEQVAEKVAGEEDKKDEA